MSIEAIQSLGPAEKREHVLGWIDIRGKPSLNGAAAEPASEKPAMDTTASDFVLAGSLKELKAKGRLVVHGRHRPVLLVQEGGHVFARQPLPPYGFPVRSRQR